MSMHIDMVTERYERERARLVAVIDAYNAAADKFIAKVDSGRARSHETYDDLKHARLMARKLED